MQQSYIKTHVNDDGDIVLHYAGDIKPDTPIEVQCLVIKLGDYTEVGKALRLEALNYVTRSCSTL